MGKVPILPNVLHEGLIDSEKQECFREVKRSVLTREEYGTAVAAIANVVGDVVEDRGAALDLSAAITRLLLARCNAPLALWWAFIAVEKSVWLDGKSQDSGSLKFAASILGFSSKVLQDLKSLSVIHCSGRMAVSATAPVVGLLFDVVSVLSSCAGGGESEVAKVQGKEFRKVMKRLRKFIKELQGFTFLCQCRDSEALVLPAAQYVSVDAFPNLPHPAFPLASKQMSKALRKDILNADVVSEAVSVQILLLELAVECIERRWQLKKQKVALGLRQDADFEAKLKGVAVQSVCSDLLLDLLQEEQLPLLDILGVEEEILVRGVLFEAVLVVPLFSLSIEGNENLQQQSVLFMKKVAVARQAVAFYKGSPGESRSRLAALSTKMSLWHAPPELLKWFATEWHKKKHRFPAAVLRDQSALTNWLVKTVDAVVFKSIMKRVNTAWGSKIERSSPKVQETLNRVVDSDGKEEGAMFFVDTAGEAGPDKNAESAADDDFALAAKSMGGAEEVPIPKGKKKKGSKLLFDRLEQATSGRKRSRLEIDNGEAIESSVEDSEDDDERPVKALSTKPETEVESEEKGADSDNDDELLSTQVDHQVLKETEIPDSEDLKKEQSPEMIKGGREQRDDTVQVSIQPIEGATALSVPLDERSADRQNSAEPNPEIASVSKSEGKSKKGLLEDLDRGLQGKSVDGSVVTLVSDQVISQPIAGATVLQVGNFASESPVLISHEVPIDGPLVWTSKRKTATDLLLDTDDAATGKVLAECFQGPVQVRVPLSETPAGAQNSANLFDEEPAVIPVPKSGKKKKKPLVEELHGGVKDITADKSQGLPVSITPSHEPFHHSLQGGVAHLEGILAPEAPEAPVLLSHEASVGAPLLRRTSKRNKGKVNLAVAGDSAPEKVLAEPLQSAHTVLPLIETSVHVQNSAELSEAEAALLSVSRSTRKKKKGVVEDVERWVKEDKPSNSGEALSHPEDGPGIHLEGISDLEAPAFFSHETAVDTPLLRTHGKRDKAKDLGACSDDAVAEKILWKAHEGVFPADKPSNERTSDALNSTELPEAEPVVQSVSKSARKKKKGVVEDLDRWVQEDNPSKSGEAHHQPVEGPSTHLEGISDLEAPAFLSHETPVETPLLRTPSKRGKAKDLRAYSHDAVTETILSKADEGVRQTAKPLNERTTDALNSTELPEVEPVVLSVSKSARKKKKGVVEDLERWVREDSPSKSAEALFHSVEGPSAHLEGMSDLEAPPLLSHETAAETPLPRTSSKRGKAKDLRACSDDAVTEKILSKADEGVLQAAEPLNKRTTDSLNSTELPEAEPVVLSVSKSARKKKKGVVEDLERWVREDSPSKSAEALFHSEEGPSTHLEGISDLEAPPLLSHETAVHTPLLRTSSKRGKAKDLRACSDDAVTEKILSKSDEGVLQAVEPLNERTTDALNSTELPEVEPVVLSVSKSARKKKKGVVEDLERWVREDSPSKSGEALFHSVEGPSTHLEGISELEAPALLSHETAGETALLRTSSKRGKAKDLRACSDDGVAEKILSKAHERVLQAAEPLNERTTDALNSTELPEAEPVVLSVSKSARKKKKVVVEDLERWVREDNPSKSGEALFHSVEGPSTHLEGISDLEASALLSHETAVDTPLLRTSSKRGKAKDLRACSDDEVTQKILSKADEGVFQAAEPLNERATDALNSTELPEMEPVVLPVSKSARKKKKGVEEDLERWVREDNPSKSGEALRHPAEGPSIHLEGISDLVTPGLLSHETAVDRPLLRTSSKRGKAKNLRACSDDAVTEKILSKADEGVLQAAEPSNERSSDALNSTVLPEVEPVVLPVSKSARKKKKGVEEDLERWVREDNCSKGGEALRHPAEGPSIHLEGISDLVTPGLLSHETAVDTPLLRTSSKRGKAKDLRACSDDAVTEKILSKADEGVPQAAEPSNERSSDALNSTVLPEVEPVVLSVLKSAKKKKNALVGEQERVVEEDFTVRSKDRSLLSPPSAQAVYQPSGSGTAHHEEISVLKADAVIPQKALIDKPSLETSKKVKALDLLADTDDAVAEKLLSEPPRGIVDAALRLIETPADSAQNLTEPPDVETVVVSVSKSARKKKKALLGEDRGLQKDISFSNEGESLQAPLSAEAVDQPVEQEAVYHEEISVLEASTVISHATPVDRPKLKTRKSSTAKELSADTDNGVMQGILMQSLEGVVNEAVTLIENPSEPHNSTELSEVDSVVLSVSKSARKKRKNPLDNLDRGMQDGSGVKPEDGSLFTPVPEEKTLSVREDVSIISPREGSSHQLGRSSKKKSKDSNEANEFADKALPNQDLTLQEEALAAGPSSLKSARSRDYELEKDVNLGTPGDGFDVGLDGAEHSRHMKGAQKEPLGFSVTKSSKKKSRGRQIKIDEMMMSTMSPQADLTQDHGKETEDADDRQTTKKLLTPRKRNRMRDGGNTEAGNLNDAPQNEAQEADQQPSSGRLLTPTKGNNDWEDLLADALQNEAQEPDQQCSTGKLLTPEKRNRIRHQGSKGGGDLTVHGTESEAISITKSDRNRRSKDLAQDGVLQDSLAIMVEKGVVPSSPVETHVEQQAAMRALNVTKVTTVKSNVTKVTTIKSYVTREAGQEIERRPEGTKLQETTNVSVEEQHEEAQGTSVLESIANTASLQAGNKPAGEVTPLGNKRASKSENQAAEEEVVMASAKTPSTRKRKPKDAGSQDDSDRSGAVLYQRHTRSGRILGVPPPTPTPQKKMRRKLVLEPSLDSE